MRRTSATLAAGALVAALAWASSPTSPANAVDPAVGVADLTQDLNQILADSRLTIAQAGVVVKSATTGEELYANNSGKLLLPASNTKLFTSAAAVDTLGLDYRFPTTVLSGGRTAGSVLAGDLVLRGTGDPTMLAEDYDALAAAVAAKGIKLVTGKLVTDDTWFDAVRLGTDWAWDDETAYYAAQISALTASPDRDYDAGSVIVSVAADGDKVKVTTTPETDYLKIVNRATVGAETDVLIERQHATNTVVITGTVADPYDEWVAVDDPTRYVASLFRKALVKHGVRVLGPTTTAPAPGGAAELAKHESMPLSELLVPFLKLSNNMHAEILTKAMGRKTSGQGTWSAGLKVSTDFAKANGVQAAEHARRLRPVQARRLLPCLDHAAAHGDARQALVPDVVRRAADRGGGRPDGRWHPAQPDAQHARGGQRAREDGFADRGDLAVRLCHQRRRRTAGVLHHAQPVPGLVAEGRGGQDRGTAGAVLPYGGGGHGEHAARR